MESIRILHVVGRMDMGGTETMIMNLFRNINRKKVIFDFVVHTNKKGHFDDEIHSLGGQIYRVPRFKLYNIFSYYKSWQILLNRITNYKLMHGHIGSSASIYLNMAKKRGLHTIAHSHNTSMGLSIKGIAFSLLSYNTRYIAHSFFACSIDAGISRFGKNIVNKNFSVINNAINVGMFEYNVKTRTSIQSKFNLKGKFVIGHVGRFNEQKNHEFVIDIFNEICKVQKNAVLLLVGDGELRKVIEEKARNLGLIDSVMFTGVRTDTADLYQAMDVFLFPSLYEGLGIVLIEAQAAGLKCIVSDVIPKEAHVTDLIKPISLKANVEIWADEVLKSASYERSANNSIIIEKGYDIKDTAKRLEDFYFEKSMQ